MTLANKISSPNFSTKQARGLQPLYMVEAGMWKRFWWHTRALKLALEIVLLAIGSVFFLSLDYGLRTLWIITTHQFMPVVRTHSWQRSHAPERVTR